MCAKHVETYVVSSDVSNIVEETDVLDKKLQQKEFTCRSAGCSNTYTVHSRRVRCVFKEKLVLLSASLLLSVKQCP